MRPGGERSKPDQSKDTCTSYSAAYKLISGGCPKSYQATISNEHQQESRRALSSTEEWGPCSARTSNRLDITCTSYSAAYKLITGWSLGRPESLQIKISTEHQRKPRRSLTSTEGGICALQETVTGSTFLDI